MYHFTSVKNLTAIATTQQRGEMTSMDPPTYDCISPKKYILLHLLLNQYSIQHPFPRTFMTSQLVVADGMRRNQHWCFPTSLVLTRPKSRVANRLVTHQDKDSCGHPTWELIYITLCGMGVSLPLILPTWDTTPHPTLSRDCKASMTRPDVHSVCFSTSTALTHPFSWTSRFANKPRRQVKGQVKVKVMVKVMVKVIHVRARQKWDDVDMCSLHNAVLV